APIHTATVPASACSTKDGSTCADHPRPHRSGLQLSPKCHHAAPYNAAAVLPASTPEPPAHRLAPEDRPQKSRSPSQSRTPSSAARSQCPPASPRSSPHGTASLRDSPPECPSSGPCTSASCLPAGAGHTEYREAWSAATAPDSAPQSPAHSSSSHPPPAED